MLLVTLAAVLIAGGEAAAQSQDDAKCHSVLASQISRYQGLALRTVLRCHRLRSSGREPLPTDCNDISQADAKGRMPAVRARAGNAIARACAGASPAVLDLYPRCPTPSSSVDDGGSTTGIDDAVELTDCLLALSDFYVSQTARAILGSPAAVLSSPHAKCQSIVGKVAAKVFRTAARERSSCQGRQEAAMGGLSYGACGGPDGDPAGKIGAAIASLRSKIARACDFGDGHVLGACGYDAVSLESCVADRIVEPLANGLVAASLQIPGTCPSSVRFTAHSGSGPKRAATRLDLGYRGNAHGLDVWDGVRGGVRLWDCDEDCEDCRVSLDPGAGNCRCDDDAVATCSTVGGPDPACGGGTCNCMIGPPLPVSFSSLPLCMVGRFVDDLDGRTGAVGDYDLTARVESRVHIGQTLLDPCPRCEGDPTADDGIRDGTCTAGEREGLSCDATGRHATWGATSLDCPPSAISAIGLPQVIRLPLSSGGQSLIAAISDSQQCEGGTCHCGVCSTDYSVACSADAECMAAGAGTCTGTTHVSKPDECPAGCTANDEGMGECDDVSDMFCNGVVSALGTGILPCHFDVDCEAVNEICPGGDCGSCALSQPRSCFRPVIGATGTAGVFGGEAVSAFCVPSAYPTSSTSPFAFADAPGYPGPGRLKVGLDFDFRCDDGSTRFELPGGSNCP